MELNKEILQVVKDIESRFDMDRRAIEKELKYKEYYIDQLVSTKANPTALKKLKHFANRLAEIKEENKYLVVEPNAIYKTAPKLKAELIWKRIPQYEDCDYMTNATGLHMQPLIQNNALVVGKRLENMSFLVFGELYILLGRNGEETIRYVLPDPEDSQGLLLQGVDKDTAPVRIARSFISQVFRARFVINPL